MTAMTKTAAIRQAKSEVTMHKQGHGYVVCSYDRSMRALRESNEHPYPMARAIVARSRAERVYRLLAGVEYDGRALLETIDEAVRAAATLESK